MDIFFCLPIAIQCLLRCLLQLLRLWVVHCQYLVLLLSLVHQNCIHWPPLYLCPNHQHCSQPPHRIQAAVWIQIDLIKATFPIVPWPRYPHRLSQLRRWRAAANQTLQDSSMTRFMIIVLDVLVSSPVFHLFWCNADLSYPYFSQLQLWSNLGPPDLSLGIDATPDLVRPSPAP